MTTVTFHSARGRLDGFQVKGHSGYAPEGQDIVCAAVSAAVSLVECTVNDVMGLEASVRVRPDSASVTLKLPGALAGDSEQTCQDLLAGLLVYLQALSGQYPENLAVFMDDDDEGR